MHNRPTDFKSDAFKFFTGGGEGVCRGGCEGIL